MDEIAHIDCLYTKEPEQAQIRQYKSKCGKQHAVAHLTTSSGTNEDAVPHESCTTHKGHQHQPKQEWA